MNPDTFNYEQYPTVGEVARLNYYERWGGSETTCAMHNNLPKPAGPNVPVLCDYEYDGVILELPEDFPSRFLPLLDKLYTEVKDDWYKCGKQSGREDMKRELRQILGVDEDS
ncbi:MAG: hypothetical protein AAF267_17820 [Deinococcota bacterium]